MQDASVPNDPPTQSNPLFDMRHRVVCHGRPASSGGIPGGMTQPYRRVLRAPDVRTVSAHPAEPAPATTLTTMTLPPELAAVASATKGFLPADEAAALYRAALAAGPGVWLEIGSYCGKSTVYLGGAARWVRGTAADG